MLPDDKGCCVSLSSLFAGESKDIVVRVQLPALAAPLDDEQLQKVLVVTCVAENVVEKTMQTQTATLQLLRPASVPALRPTNLLVDMQRNRVLAAEAFEKVLTLAQQGRMRPAREAIRSAIERIRISASGEEEFSRGLLADLKLALDDLLEREKLGALQGATSGLFLSLGEFILIFFFLPCFFLVCISTTNTPPLRSQHPPLSTRQRRSTDTLTLHQFVYEGDPARLQRQSWLEGRLFCCRLGCRRSRRTDGRVAQHRVDGNCQCAFR